MLRLFAPVLPYVTEEVWSWWQEGSVHRAPWPTVDELPMAPEGDPALLSAVAAVLQQVRKAKSVAQISMRAPVDRVEVQGAEAALVGRAETDLKAAGVISELVLGSSEKDELTVDVTLGTVPAS
jgi:valyl-tRNA synthetase